MANNKDQRALARAASKAGYLVGYRKGSGHWRVTAECGCYITFSSSPGRSGGVPAARRDFDKFHARHRGGRCSR